MISADIVLSEGIYVGSHIGGLHPSNVTSILNKPAGLFGKNRAILFGYESINAKAKLNVCLACSHGKASSGCLFNSLSVGICKDNDAQALMSHAASVERVVQASVERRQMCGHGTPNI